MEILIKKDNTGKSSASLQELADLIQLSHLKKQMRDFQLLFEKFKVEYKPDKKDILAATSSEYLKRGDVLITKIVGSVEKNESLPTGSIYYNEEMDALRLKTKQGWKSIILE